MARAAKKLENDELKFFSSINEVHKSLPKIDLCFTSCALQYIEDPIDCLNQLLNIRAPNFYLTRTPFQNFSETTVSTLQSSQLANNGPGALPFGFKDREVKYPAFFAPLHEIEKIIKLKYDVNFKTLEERSSFSAENNKIDMYGFYGSLKQ